MQLIFYSNIATTTNISPSEICNSLSFRWIEENATNMCISVRRSHYHTWEDARIQCEKDGADLIVLDTNEKIQMMTAFLNSMLFVFVLHTYIIQVIVIKRLTEPMVRVRVESRFARFMLSLLYPNLVNYEKWKRAHKKHI